MNPNLRIEELLNVKRMTLSELAMKINELEGRVEGENV